MDDLQLKKKKTVLDFQFDILLNVNLLEADFYIILIYTVCNLKFNGSLIV